MNNPPPAYIIIGATGGIGAALARLLAARGARLMLAARREEPLQSLAQELAAHHLSADALDASQLEALFQHAAQRLGAIQGVVNLAGSILLKPAHLTTDQDWDDTIAQNLSTAFRVLRAAVRAMSTERGGSIVLMGSAAGRIGLANHEAIAAAKGGVAALTLAAAATYAPRNIRVNCVAPGLTNTPLAHRITSNDASLKASSAMHPLGRIAQPDDVAHAIAFLLDPNHAFITGQVIGVDGGLATVRSR